MRKRNILLLFFLSLVLIFTTFQGFSQFKPTQISGLKLWLRADSNYTLSGSEVSQWKDCSGNNYHASQSTSANRPTWVDAVINNKPVVRFDGSNDNLIGDTLDNLSTGSFDVFIVISGASESTQDAFSTFFGIGIRGSGFMACRYLWSANQDMVLQNSGTYLFSPANDLPNSGYNFKIFQISKEYNASLDAYINGNLIANSTSSGAIGSFTNDSYYLGTMLGSYISFYKGDMAEVIIYNSVLGSTDRQKVVDYLRNKYAKQINLGPDINVAYGFKDTTLNAGTGFTNYLWKNGATTQTISVNKSGTYWAQADDFFGYLSKDTVKVTYPDTKLNYGNDTTLCYGSTLTLKSIIKLKKKYTFKWYNNGTQVSTDSTLSVADSGRYWVMIKDSLNNTASSDTIHVLMDYFAQKVKLGNDTTLCSGNYIGIRPPLHNSQNLTYTWTGGLHDTILAIITTGNYAVTVTNQYSCTGKDTIHVTISGTAPTTLFKADTVCFGDPTHFTDLSTSGSGDPINKWHWDIYLTDTSNQINPVYTFPTSGTHSVKLTTYSQGGCSNYYYKNVLVNAEPVPAFSVGTACVNNPYSFIDQSAPASLDTIVGWNWDFGDSSPHSTLKNPTHTYTTAGTYSVTLIITTKKGCQRSVSHNINVVSSYALPGQPVLVYPTPALLTSDTTIDFLWLSSANAIQYELFVANDAAFNSIIYQGFTDSLHKVVSFPSSSDTIFWKVKAYNLCNNSSVSVTQNVIIFSPVQINGLKLWLRADNGAFPDMADRVYLWNDGSGHHHNSEQSNVPFRPILVDNAINGKPALRFDGINDFLQGDTIENIDMTSLNIFIIASGANASVEDAFSTAFGVGLRGTGLLISRYLWSANQNMTIANNGTYLNTANSSLPNSGFPYRLFELKKTFNSDIGIYFNSELKVATTAAPATGAFTNGSYGVGYMGVTSQQYISNWNGDIAEILLFSDTLSHSNKINVENYLYTKYAGPPVNLGPDIVIGYGFCPVILDAGGRFTNYLWSTGDTTQTISVSRAGTYSVTATNYFGILSSDTINITKPDIYLSDTGVCLNTTLVLNSGLNHSYDFLWSDGTTDSIFSTAVAGNFWLRVSDTLGCWIADTFNVVADSFPAKVSLGPDRNICSGELLGLSEGAPEAILYFWSNGSGSSLIVIPDPVGTCPNYSVTVTNHNSCIGIDTVHLCVTGVKPDVDFSFDSVCFGSPTHFWDASTVLPPDSINGRKWMFFDGDSSYLLNPSHIFSHDGVFNVRLNVTSKLGCNTSFVKPVTVFSIPSPDFIPLLGCSTGPTRFSDRASCDYGNIVNWHWEFDDPGSGGNDTSFQENPIHNFDNPGTYSVLQRVVTDIGCLDSVRKDVVIKSSPPADYSSTTTCIGKETFFADQTIVPPQDEILEWHWKFGDGDSSTLKNPAHLYTSSGYYTAVMKVKSLNGCWGAMTKNIKVHAMPDAAFSTIGSCLTFGTQFTDSTSIFNDTITNWKWQFDNGQTSNLQNPLYVYPDTGIYNVSLNVTTNAGCRDSVVSAVEVHSLPTAQFTFNPEYGESPLEVNFYNQSLRGSSYLWDFGDGTGPSTNQNPVHVYNANGIYKIALTTYNIYNCPDTVSYYVFVIPSYSDIMVKSVNAEIKDNKLSIKAELKNVGSRRLRHLELTAHVSNENSIIEDWNGILSPGESMTYEFSAKFYVSSQQNIDYVCVNAEVKDDNTEVNKSDNEACAVLTDEFSVQNPYPNPANNSIFITYIVPFEEVVDVKLYDTKGSLVYTIFSGTANQGFNKIKLDISLLSQGVYAYKVVFRDKIKTGRFVKY